MCSMQDTYERLGAGHVQVKHLRFGQLGTSYGRYKMKIKCLTAECGAKCKQAVGSSLFLRS